MIDHHTAMDLAALEALSAPCLDKQERRSASLATNRPVKNSRPLGWVFIGKLSMPRSEHLIPFLN